MSRALLHIGTPKTGTTSFQEWAWTSRQRLESESNTRVYKGLFGTNHYEFGLLCKRLLRNGFGELEFPDWCLPEWRSEARHHIRREIETAKAADKNILISSEAISLLRHDDELDRLKDLLGDLEVRGVAAVREPEAFLRSWRRQIGPGGWSAYHSSAGYSEPDSWLVDYAAMVESFEEGFGTGSLRIVNYEEALKLHGTVIPAIAEALELDSVDLSVTHETPWMNSSKLKPAALIADPADASTPEISRLHRQLRLLARERDGLKTQLELAEREACERREASALLEQELLQAQHDRDTARFDAERSSLTIASMASSMSWRATKPARGAKQTIVRRLPASARRLSAATSLIATAAMTAVLAAFLLLA